MRRNMRRQEEKEKSKSVFYIAGILLSAGIISFVITFILYGNKMEEQTRLGQERISELMGQSLEDTESASTQMGKTVSESQNAIQSIIENTTTTNTNSVNKTNTTNKTTNTTSKSQSNTAKQDSNTKKEETTNNDAKQVIEDPKFIKPVDGEIIKDFAKDSLVYSETLQEWTTHLGIDIKAEKTTIVKASESGKVKSIKNDPRYGLSIIIEHQNGYETLYANLLTSEFVQVGEEVKQGQSIGTVGTTATFEIADEPHLHFEITKNGETIDPNQYM